VDEFRPMTLMDKVLDVVGSRSTEHVATPFLSVELHDEGPRDAPVVLLLHGWPDDPSTWANVIPTLNTAGLRTVAPYLRGFGRTRFLDDATPRTGNTGILAHDAVDLMDALGIERFFVAGHDWGSNTAEALAVGWPDRVPGSRCCRRLRASAACRPRRSGKPSWTGITGSRPPGAVLRRCTPTQRVLAHHVGRLEPVRMVRGGDLRDGLAVLGESGLARRQDEAEADPRSAALEASIKATKRIDTPTIYVGGAVDRVNPPEAAKEVRRSSRGRSR
jgi:pimeloyl-ACP methyl ester carboxylesterase